MVGRDGRPGTRQVHGLRRPNGLESSAAFLAVGSLALRKLSNLSEPHSLHL